MADHLPRALGRGTHRAITALAVIGLCLAGAPVARADGDPASDVLVAAPPLFLGLDSGATYAQKLVLERQLRVAAGRGSTLRVAVIATRSDLGSVSALWGHPQAYARFLGRELSLDYRGTLLVAMPDGFAVARDGTLESSPLSGLAPRRGELLTATEQAVARLTGVPVPGPASRAARTTPTGTSRTSGPGWWAASIAAAIAIAIAWTASLRRRPLRRRRPFADQAAG